MQIFADIYHFVLLIIAGYTFNLCYSSCETIPKEVNVIIYVTT